MTTPMTVDYDVGLYSFSNGGFVARNPVAASIGRILTMFDAQDLLDDPWKLRPDNSGIDPTKMTNVHKYDEQYY